MNKIYAALFAIALLFSSASYAQIFPYYEAFDSYTAPQPINGVGGFVATSHVQVTAHGVVGNCVEFQMAAATPGNDTLASPLIGPLTANTATSFYFRIVKYVSGVPTLYTLAANESAVIGVGPGNLSLVIPQYTITSANQNTNTNYVKVTVAAPSFVNGLPGKFQIIASNPTGHDWQLEMDSFVIRDTVQIPPILTSTVINDSCRADSTGSIHVNASGASPPYVYHWNTGATTSFLTHLAAGIYSVTVTDSLNATATLSDTVQQPASQLQLDSLTKTNVLCHGTATGTAEIYPKGGTPGYSYLWTNTPPQTTQQAQNLSAGNYSVTVTDSKGCKVTATTQLSEPPALTVSVTTTGSTGSNGTATAIANGGTSPFSFLWSPSGQTTAIANGLAPGGYVISVTDGNGCVVTDSITITNPTGITEATDSKLTIYPNPTSGLLYLSIEGATQQAITVNMSDMSGRVIVADDVVNGSINLSGFTEGIYVLRATSEGQTYIRRIVVQK